MFPDAENILFYSLSKQTILRVILGVLPVNDYDIIFLAQYPKFSYFYNTAKQNPPQYILLQRVKKSNSPSWITSIARG